MSVPTEHSPLIRADDDTRIAIQSVPCAEEKDNIDAPRHSTLYRIFCCPGSRKSLLIDYLCVDPTVEAENVRSSTPLQQTAMGDVHVTFSLPPNHPNHPNRAMDAKPIRITPLSRWVIVTSGHCGPLLLLLPLTLLLEAIGMAVCAAFFLLFVFLDMFSYCGTNFSAK
eukprot:Opistho-2@65657